MKYRTTYIHSLIISLIFFLSCGERRDPTALYYFPNADTTYVGVKNGLGDIIIPAEHPSLNNADINFLYFGRTNNNYKRRVFYTNNDSLIPEARYDFEKPITGPVIQFFGLSIGSKAAMEGPRIPAGEVYSRKGKFLYYIAGYAARQYTGYYIITPQPFAEGYGLYVEKGKLGYIDGVGNKITTANWEYAEPFNYGYAKVYRGRWEQVQLPGYMDHRPLNDTSNIAYINVKGEIIKHYNIAKGDKDYHILLENENGYLPYPFSYTAKEQSILDSLNNIKAIGYTNIIDILSVEYKKERLHFEITARPKPGFPYYYVQGYWGDLGDSRYTFLVHEDTHAVFHYGQPFFMEEVKTSLSQWIVNGLQETNERWSEEMPGVKLDMDVARELRYWKQKAKEEGK
ncbi:hypothetical protein [Sphingobacterium deserti]|uniref:KWG Leptospira repeat protein n=1 Tax=Sphingobacterium deserti TaxID=1229276 RepID=A0A0B8SYQ2_9SPHI|nr:hypothetical protein [Sphingobacterium deserti]KGE12512.1 hypothetical protein DI53_3552 [Sphingobacterium deserti]